MSQILIPLVTALAVFIKEPLASQPKPATYLRNRLLSLDAGVVAFRCGALEGLENSLPACEQALKLGVSGVHFDVRKTYDGELVLAAQDELHRVTGQHLLLSETRYVDLPPLRESIVSEFGETYESLESQTKSGQLTQIPKLEAALDLFVENDAFVIIQDHTFNFEDTKEILIIAKAKGLLNRLILQTDVSRWEKLRKLSKVPLNLMEPANSLEERFEEFVHGDYQKRTETLETDLFNTTFDLKTVRESPLEVREAPLSIVSQKVAAFSWPSEQVTLEQFGQTMKQFKSYVQLMNMTYQQKSRVPVSYFLVNHVEDLRLVRELRANLVFTERPAELLVEKFANKSPIQREQWNFQK